MTDRDRLIELLFKVAEEKDCPQPHEIADTILADGWIRPPCYIGQTVYQLYEKYNGDLIIRQGKVSAIQQKADKSWKVRITINHYVFEITLDKIGETVFLTKEEAEEKLKELR